MCKNIIVNHPICFRLRKKKTNHQPNALFRALKLHSMFQQYKIEVRNHLLQSPAM